MKRFWHLFSKLSRAHNEQKNFIAICAIRHFVAHFDHSKLNWTRIARFFVSFLRVCVCVCMRRLSHSQRQFVDKIWINSFQWRPFCVGKTVQFSSTASYANVFRNLFDCKLVYLTWDEEKFAFKAQVWMIYDFFASHTTIGGLAIELHRWRRGETRIFCR